MLSNKIKGIEPSSTLSINAKVKQLRKKGKNVIDFGVGEPDFPTPQNIKIASIKAINDDFTHYTSSSGIVELRQAIAEKLLTVNNVDYTSEEVSISCGGKFSIYLILLSLLNPGDEVIIPKPFWVSYIEQIKLTDGIPVIAEVDNDLKIRADLLRDKITDKTKLIILNSPCNPTGTVCEESELKRIADLICENQLYLLSDEVYEYFIYDKKHHVSISSFNDDIKNRTIISNSFSKTYSMTGWRIGYSAGPLNIIKAINMLQSHTISNPTSIAQKAALEALGGSQTSITNMVKVFDERRKFMVDKLNDMNAIMCPKPEGAFYAFPDIGESGLNSIEFTNQLLDEELVAVIPGISFGDDKHIRLSYASSLEQIKEGMDRMERFCEEL